MFFQILLLVLPGVSEAAVCATKTVGEANPSTKNDILAGTTNYNYALTDASYTFDCCGLVTGWTAYINATGTIRFQVLRPSGSSYKLAGENVLNFGTADQTNKEQVVTISTGSQISVHPNDHIGWYTTADQIPYSTSSINGNLGKTTTAPSVGSSISFSGGDILNGRTYAISAQIVGNTPPKFKNLPMATTLVQPDVPYDSYLYQLEGEDVDPQDSITITQVTSHDLFYLNPTKWIRTRKAHWKVGVYSIDYKIADDCGNEQVATFKFQIKNTPPDISNLPNTKTAITIKEDVSIATKLLELSVTDFHDFTCTYAGTDPFTVKYDTGSGKWVVYYDGYTTNLANKLNYDNKNQYTLPISCTDVLNDPDTSTTTANLIVDVLKNEKPKVKNLPATKTISARAIKKNDPIFTVTGEDVDSAALTYNMTCTPSATCPFKMASDGKITATDDLDLHKVEDYTINAYVSDGNSLSDAGVLQITIEDINVVPVINNIPTGLKKTIDENSAIGTEVFDVNAEDGNPADTAKFAATFTNGGDKYFEINKDDGKIKTIADINYEDLLDKGTTTFTVGVTAEDGRETSSPVKYFTISVTDVNEPQTGFTEKQYEIAGAIEIPSSFKNVFTLVDPDDTRDKQTYSMDCGTKYSGINIDSSTAEVSWSSQIDLDPLNLEEDEITCKVTATDKANHKTETELKIKVTEINDNNPELDKSIYTYSLPINTPPGSGFGAFTVTDKDIKDENKKSTYALTGSDDFDVRDCCSFITSTDLSKYSVGKTFEMDLVVTNTKTGILDTGGSTTRKTTAKVQVILTDPTTTTTTTTAATTANINLGLGGIGSGGSAGGTGSFLDDPENLGWFIPTMIALAGMLALLAYMIYRILRNPGFFANLNLCKGLRNNGFKGFNCQDRCNCKKYNKKTAPKYPKVKDPVKNPGKYEWNIWSTSDFSNKTVELR